MISTFVAGLELPISTVRLESYRSPGDADLDMIVNYLWNIELSEALYPSLQAVEVSLRNSIHTAASTHYQSEYWFDHANVLLPAQTSKIRDARSELGRLGKPQTAGRMIAALSFGFWVQLFNRPYERAPRNVPTRLSWHDNDLAMFDAVFPNAPRRVRNREAMRRQCEAIRDLRNRVFHYEPVWRQPDLKRQHANILDLIGWISPQMRSTVGLCDHFTLTHEGGRATIEERLKLHLGLI